MNVTENTKNAYRTTSVQKEVRLYFPDLDLTVGTSQLDSDSMELIESLSESDSIEFIGCISSQFKITVHDVSENLKGENIEAYISTDGTEEMCLFHGKVNDVSISANKSHKSITAYDLLYEKGDIDVAEWYKGLTFPITLGNLRNSLFSYLGITQVSINLPNDNIEIEKQYSPNTMKSLDVIKSICQINGVFGIINRSNYFEYRTLPKTESATVNEQIEYQKSLEYQEYVVSPVDKLTIRQLEQDEGVSYGDGDNNYIIQGNMFTLNLEEETLAEIAENIYPNVEGFYYRPCDSDNNGFPWIECGNIVSYQVYDYDNSTIGNPIYKTMTFYILKRTLSGIQNLRDSYEAEGDEFQRVFITDIQSKVETIVESIQEISGRLEDYSLNYVYFVNTEKVVIRDGDTVSIANTNFLVMKPTQVMIDMEYLLYVDTTYDGKIYNSCEITAKYYLDDVLIYTRLPMETYVDGNHILHLTYFLNIEDDLSHDWEVTLTADGGDVIIEIGQAVNVIHGQKLMQSVWDGRIKIRQDIARIVLNHPSIGIDVIGISDSVSATLQEPESANIEDEIGMITLGHPTHALTMIGLTDGVSVDVTQL